MCVGVFVCGCTICTVSGLHIKYVFTVSGCIQDFGSGGTNWGNEKCRWGEVIRIICLLMNLTDPRGGGSKLYPGGPAPPLNAALYSMFALLALIVFDAYVRQKF